MSVCHRQFTNSKMKYYLGIVAVFLALAQVKCGEAPEELKKLIADCVKETGVTPKAPINYDDPQMKCFAACLMKKGGDLVDGKVVVEKSIELSAKYLPGGVTDSIKAALTECASKANEGKDECEVAGAFGKCAAQVFPRQ